jgi:hypothetical protein
MQYAGERRYGFFLGTTPIRDVERRSSIDFNTRKESEPRA